MKTMLTTAMMLMVATGAAFADGGAGPTQFTTWEAQFAKAAHPTAVKPAVQPVPVEVYMNSQRQGTWLFPANANEGSNN